MFSVIYSFKVKPGYEEQFIKAWEDITRMIYQYERSLGSRLHKSSELGYIAYAQWPDIDKWDNSGSKLPASSGEIRTRMRESCEKIETLYELEVVSDLLQATVYRA